MESPITAIRPSTSREHLPLDITETQSPIAPETLEDSNLTEIDTLPLPEAPRARAETATSTEIREVFIAPEERLKQLCNDVQKTLAAFEDSGHPRLPECVYEGLRKCASELGTIATFNAEPHILQMEDIDPSAFQRQETPPPKDKTPE